MENIKHIRLLKGFSIGSKCKGIWISRDIMHSSNLTLVEKIIVSVVAGFQKGDKDCFVSNQTFADICSCDARTITRTIHRLKSAKILHYRHKVIQGQMRRILWL